MTNQAKPASRPWRRFLRFSVRGMIVLVLIVGAWLGWIVRSARIQSEAVEAIRDAGGQVQYDWEFAGQDPMKVAHAPPPRLLADLVGVDYFSDVTYVLLRGRHSPATFGFVGVFRKLQSIDSAGSNIDDAGIACVKGLPCLTSLWLSDTRLSDAALIHLRKLTSLSTLDLSAYKNH